MLKELVLEKIKQSNELTMNDCKKLIDLGFNKTTTVDDFLIRNKFKDLIREYELLYPQNPFVTEENLNEILVENQNLRFRTSNNYIYSIPYKNIQDILNFKINKKYLTEGEWLHDGSSTRAHFHILAPSTMFINSNSNEFDPDPVVFCKVKGGYLMVTSWGEESKLISNPKIN